MKTFEDLVEAFESENPVIRRNAISLLFRLDDKRVPTLMIQALQDETILVRVSASGGLLSRLFLLDKPPTLNAFEPTCYVDPLVRLIETEKNHTIIWCAINVLGRIDDARILPLLKGLSKHDNPRVRDNVAEILGLIGGEEAIEILGSLVKDEDERVRWLAVTQLGHIDSEQVIKPLLNALGDGGRMYAHFPNDFKGVSVVQELALEFLQKRRVPISLIEAKLLKLVDAPDMVMAENAAILLDRFQH